MTIYTNALALVLRQMADKGQLGAIRRTVTAGGSATSVTSGTETVTDYPARFVLFPVDQRDIDGTFIKAGDWRVILSPSQPADAGDWDDGETIGNIETITPTSTDLLICTEGALTIIDPGKFAPADTVTHYKMVARK